MKKRIEEMEQQTANRTDPKLAQAQTRDDLGDQAVEVRVGWALDVEVPATNVVESLVVLRGLLSCLQFSVFWESNGRG